MLFIPALERQRQANLKYEPPLPTTPTLLSLQSKFQANQDNIAYETLSTKNKNKKKNQTDKTKPHS